jgi:hypothetical protein
MLPDYGRYYGSALTHIVDHCPTPVTISRLDIGVQGYYLLNGKVPLYIKFCRNRKGPWGFTFQRDHQVQYQRVVDEYGDCVLAANFGNECSSNATSKATHPRKIGVRVRNRSYLSRWDREGEAQSQLVGDGQDSRCTRNPSGGPAEIPKSSDQNINRCHALRPNRGEQRKRNPSHGDRSSSKCAEI